MDLIAIATRLQQRLSNESFGPPVSHVYRPLDYAWAPHREYLERYGRRPREIVLVGMNPGPFGMTQTGVPFGDISMVRDWLGIRSAVQRPAIEHSKRPILGFDCRRSEVSGTRLWGWARDTFGDDPARFFKRFFVANYCPLCFLEASGRNLTPDKLPRSVRDRVEAACDEALRATVSYLEPRIVLGVGGFAEKRARVALEGMDLPVGRVPHPSPASPAANRGWADAMNEALARQGIVIP